MARDYDASFDAQWERDYLDAQELRLDRNEVDDDDDSWIDSDVFVEEFDDEPDQFRNDVEADADALASAGWGTDEDYHYDSYDSERDFGMDG